MPPKKPIQIPYHPNTHTLSKHGNPPNMASLNSRVLPAYLGPKKSKPARKPKAG